MKYKALDNGATALFFSRRRKTTERRTDYKPLTYFDVCFLRRGVVLLPSKFGLPLLFLKPSESENRLHLDLTLVLLMVNKC